MDVFSTHRRRVTAAAAAVAVALGGGAAAVVAATAPASAGPAAVTAAATTPAHTHAGHHRARTLLARSDHATLELRVKGSWQTFELDRGKVQAVSATSITLLRPDGQTVTEKIDAATHFGGVASAAAVKTGQRATVVSEDGTARRVAQHVGARGAAGATTTSGAVTAS